MRILNLFTFGVIMSLTSVPACAQEWSAAEREAWTAIAQSWEALRAEDVDRFMESFHPQFLGWSMSRDAPLDLDAERRGTETFLAAFDWVAYEIEPVAIRAVGDDAIVHYRYREVVRDVATGAVHEETGRATQVLKRVDGRWKTFTIMSGPVAQ